MGPEVASILLSVDRLAEVPAVLAPVTGFAAHGSVTEARGLSLPGVIAAPVKQEGAQLEEPVGVVGMSGMILYQLPLLPHQKIVHDGVHDGTEMRRFSLHSLEGLAALSDRPEVVRYQAAQMGVPELHRQVVRKICRTKEQRRHRATVFVPEQGNSITHPHHPLVAGVRVHSRIGCHLLVPPTGLRHMSRWLFGSLRVQVRRHLFITEEVVQPRAYWEMVDLLGRSFRSVGEYHPAVSATDWAAPTMRMLIVSELGVLAVDVRDAVVRAGVDLANSRFANLLEQSSGESP